MFLDINGGSENEECNDFLNDSNSSFEYISFIKSEGDLKEEYELGEED